MRILAHLANFGLDVIDVLPRRRVPPLLGLALIAIVLMEPGLIEGIAQIRAEALLDRLNDVLQAEGGR